jgi:uncharacterized membrane protein YoaK (UPF0700 family)
VNTTTITANLASVMEGLVAGIGPARSSIVASAGRADGLARQVGSPASATRLHAALFLAYGLGAFVGGVAELRWHLSAIYLPIALVLIVIVTAFVRFHDRAPQVQDGATAAKP